MSIQVEPSLKWPMRLPRDFRSGVTVRKSVTKVVIAQGKQVQNSFALHVLIIVINHQFCLDVSDKWLLAIGLGCWSAGMTSEAVQAIFDGSFSNLALTRLLLTRLLDKSVKNMAKCHFC